MKRGKVTALVMAFIMAVSVLASPVTMLNTNAGVKAKKITMAKKATLEVGAKKKLKVTVKPAKAGQKIHLIVQAQDDGEHTLTHYQQLIITIK